MPTLFQRGEFSIAPCSWVNLWLAIFLKLLQECSTAPCTLGSIYGNIFNGSVVNRTWVLGGMINSWKWSKKSNCVWVRGLSHFATTSSQNPSGHGNSVRARIKLAPSSVFIHRSRTSLTNERCNAQEIELQPKPSFKFLYLCVHCPQSWHSDLNVTKLTKSMKVAYDWAAT